MNLKSDLSYWKVFNVFVDITGFTFFFTGILIGYWGLPIILGDKPVPQAVKVDFFMFKVLISLVSVVLIMVGIFAMALSLMSRHSQRQEEKEKLAA